MHFFRRLFKGRVLDSTKLIFDIPPGARVEIVVPDGGEKPEQDPRRRAAEAGQKREEVKITSQEDRERILEEQDKLGEAKDYVETFRTSAKFDVVAGLLEAGIASEGHESRFNPDNWLVESPDKVAQIYRISFFPHGKGKNAFLEGLEAATPDPNDKSPEAEALRKKVDASREANRQIVALLKNFLEKKRTTKQDVQAQTEKSPFGERVGDGARTLMKNFNRGSGTEKLLMLGAAGLLVHFLWKHKGDKFFGTTFEKIGLGAAAIWGLNYLSGKVSKDGKTLVQRLDIGLDIEDMKNDNVLKSFAYKYGMEKDQEKLRTLIRMQTLSASEMFRLYEEASSLAVTKKEIDPKKLGFYKNEVDGKALYDIMDTLVRETAINERIRKRKERCRIENIPYTNPTEAEINAWTEGSRAREEFAEKYITGPLGRTNPKIIDVVVNEFQEQDVQKIIAEGQAGRRYARAYRAGREGAEAAWDYTRVYGAIAGRYVYEKGGRVYTWARDRVVSPMVGYIQATYNEDIKPYTTDLLKDGRSWSQERDLKKVLPHEEWGLDVTSPGKATMLGLPDVAFEISTAGGKSKAIIEGVTFVLEDGVSGNRANISALEAKLKNRVLEIARREMRGKTALVGAVPEWDTREKHWYIKGVKVNQDVSNENHTLLDLGGIETGTDPAKPQMIFRIDRKGKAHFLLNKFEVRDFKQLDIAYRNSVIQRKIWEYKAPGWRANYLEDIPVTVESVKANTDYKAEITGKIGGLSFKAVPKKNDLDNGIEFFDGTRTGGLDMLTLTGTEGEKFIAAMHNKVGRSKYFNEAFADVENVMANASEGLLARLGELAKGPKRLWILPTNIRGALNGKILEQQWRHTVHFKRWETLSMFSNALNGQKLSEMERLYQAYIVRSHDDLTKLFAHMKSLSDHKLADQFDELLGDEVIDNTGQKIQGLERLNYGNAEYQELFKEFRDSVKQPHYDYVGADGLDNFRSYEVYQMVMTVWSFNTNQYANQSGLSQQNKNDIRRVTRKILAHLDRAQGSGAIKKENLPPTKTAADLQSWVV